MGSIVNKFLEFLALSARERHNTLQDANLLDGLDSLYQEILNILSKSTVGKRKWHLIFSGGSLYLLNTEAVRVALSIVPGEHTDELQYLNNFAESVSKTTFALLEVDSAGIPPFPQRISRDKGISQLKHRVLSSR